MTTGWFILFNRTYLVLQTWGRWRQKDFLLPSMIYVFISFNKSGDLSLLHVLNLPCTLLILPTLRIVSKVIMEAFLLMFLFGGASIRIMMHLQELIIGWWIDHVTLYNKSTNVIILGPQKNIVLVSGPYKGYLLSFLSSKISFSFWFSIFSYLHLVM